MDQFLHEELAYYILYGVQRDLFNVLHPKQDFEMLGFYSYEELKNIAEEYEEINDLNSEQRQRLTQVKLFLHKHYHTCLIELESDF